MPELVLARPPHHRYMKRKLLTARGASTSGLVAMFTAAPHLVAVIAADAALLALLVFAGIALPAVWSSKSARRKAAAAVLGQILAALRRQRGSR